MGVGPMELFVLGPIAVLFLLIGIGIPVAVGVDARRRGLDAGLAIVVGLVALVSFPLGPLLWLLFRDRLVATIRGGPQAATSTRLPPAGWYADPDGQPGRRWWDGERWTEHRDTGAV